MERFVGRDHIAHLITDPRAEDPHKLKKVVKDALVGGGGVIIKPAGEAKRETFTSQGLKSVKNPTKQEIEQYAAAVTLRIVSIAQSATVFEYSTSS